MQIQQGRGMLPPSSGEPRTLLSLPPSFGEPSRDGKDEARDGERMLLEVGGRERGSNSSSCRPPPPSSSSSNLAAVKLDSVPAIRNPGVAEVVSSGGHGLCRR